MHGVLTPFSGAQLRWEVEASRRCVKIVLEYEGISKAVMKEVRQLANAQGRKKTYDNVERGYTNSDGKIHIILKDATTLPLVVAILNTLGKITNTIIDFSEKEEEKERKRTSTNSFNREPRRRRSKRDRRAGRLGANRAKLAHNSQRAIPLPA